MDIVASYPYRPVMDIEPEPVSQLTRPLPGLLNLDSSVWSLLVFSVVDLIDPYTVYCRACRATCSHVQA
jgi:hypothetical protein